MESSATDSGHLNNSTGQGKVKECDTINQSKFTRVEELGLFTPATRPDRLKIYYFESTRIAGETILRYDASTAFTPIACSSPRWSAP